MITELFISVSTKINSKSQVKPSHAFFSRTPGVADMRAKSTIALLLIMVAIEVFPFLLYSSGNPANSITIHNGAASTKTLRILLTIALIGTPLAALYTGFVFWTFKGKVKLDEMSY